MLNTETNKTCCFFGHRKVKETEELKNKLYKVIENLIVNENTDTFLFGSKSDFNSLCLEITTSLKDIYPHIRRIYVRAEFQYIDDSYREYLAESYEDTYYPEHISKAGKAVYVERNIEMINKSRFCVTYFDENYAPPRRKQSKRALTDYQPKSGTARAYDYAVKKKKEIINVLN